MFGGDEVSAIVMDLGSSCTKSGYAGEDCPKFVIPSSVGVIGGEEAAAQEGPSKRTFHVGTNALAVPREGMRVEGALRDGIVADWDAAEALMEHSLKSCLGCDPTDHPLLLAEPSFNPAANRTKLTELAFEKFQIPALFLSKNAVLAAFAAGRGTAMVLDVGGGATCAAAVHDGYVQNKPLKKSSAPALLGPR
jgi:actin-like protein 6A